MAARHVVVAAVAQAVSELQSSVKLTAISI